MKTKKFVALMLIVVLSLSLVACGNNDEAPAESNESGQETNTEVSGENVLKFGTDLSGVQNLDIQLTSMNDIYQITLHTNECLLGLETDTLELYPLLLTDIPTVSEDGKTYSCELKPDIKFHDGTTLTSSDVKYTFERMFTPATKCANAWLCDMIEGAREMLDGEATELKGFNVIDDTHFEITINDPYSAFMSVLAAPQTVIYPEKACEEAGDSWGTSVLVGTGPYKLKDFDSKNKVTLEKNEDYHGGAKDLDEIVFLNMDPNTALLEFENGTIDVTNVDFTIVDTYLENEDFKDNIEECYPLGIVHLIINTEMEPLNEVAARQALNYATDRQSLVDNYLRGHAIPAYCFLPKGIPGYDDNVEKYDYNPEKAKELLAEAGFPDGIEITASVSEKSTYTGVLEVLQEQWKEAGIDLTIQKIDNAAFVDQRQNGELQIYPMGWFADIIDPDNFLYSIFYSVNSPSFSSHYKNDEFDKMCEDGRMILDPSEKDEFYKDVDYKAVHEDVVVLPLYNPIQYYLVSDRIEGAVRMDNSLYRFFDAKVVK